jgi:hypothetical protein
MRALADLAYLLGQYEFAVQSYRLAAQDYLAAPNSRWYAGAEVSSAVCCGPQLCESAPFWILHSSNLFICASTYEAVWHAQFETATALL